MLHTKSAFCCNKTELLSSLQETRINNMGDPGCPRTDLDLPTPYYTKHSSPIVGDVSELSTFAVPEQSPSPIVLPSSAVPDSECSSAPDTTQDSATSCSQPASRPITPSFVSQDISPQTHRISVTDSLLTANHVAARRPRHKPGERRELLTRAVHDVINLKISMRRAAQKYNLAKSSLCDFVRKNKIPLPNLRYKASQSTSAEVTPNVSTTTSRAPGPGTKRSHSEMDRSSNPTCLSQNLYTGDPKAGNASRDFFQCPDRPDISLLLKQTSDQNVNNFGENWVISNSLNLSTRTTNSADTGRYTTPLSLFKSGRIESPWHNSAGLPTQVPMRSWSTHVSQNSNFPPSVATSAQFGRKLPATSFSQAVDSTNTNKSSLEQCSKCPETVNFAESSSLPATSGFEDGTISRSSDSFDESALNNTESIEKSSFNEANPVENQSTSSASLNGSSSRSETPVTSGATRGRINASPAKCETLGTGGTANPTRDANAFVQPRGDLHAAISQLSGITHWPISDQPALLGALPPIFSTAPCSSLASILSPDFSSVSQNALTALLLQHSRNLPPAGISAVPNLINYSPGQSINNTPQPLLANDFSLPSMQQSIPFQPNLPNSSQTIRLSSGPAASTLNHLASQLWNTDLTPPQPDSVDELQKLFYKQLQSCLQTDVNTANPGPYFSPLTASLFPQLYGSYAANSPIRHIVNSLLGFASNPSQLNAPSFTTSSHDTDLVHQAVPTVGAISSQLFTPINMNKVSSHTKGLIDFINSSPSPFHAVQTACDLLSSHGFRELKESELWSLKPQDCVFLKKNGSTILAAAIGGRYKPGNGFHLIGAHTDSPSLRLKPVSDRVKEGYVQLGVEAYGGGLWYTWFDRELKVAGRVIAANADGRLEEHLVHIDRPIACVPSLAIHLNPDVRTHGFAPNFEQHVVPILCTNILDQVNKTERDPSVNMTDVSVRSMEDTATEVGPNPSAKRRHPAGLLRALVQHLNLPQDPLEIELYLSDCQPARVGGLHEEFIHAPRLDNLFNSYGALHGLLASSASLADDESIRIVCLYDHEEVGSTSTQGANSSFTMNVLRRIANALVWDKHTEAEQHLMVNHFEQSLSKSFLLSADQAHAVHPCYPDKHEACQKPQLHGGLVLKSNVNQRYATNALTAAAVRQLSTLAEIPIQEFVNRQDMQCGSTIGPMLASQLGVPTVDVGFPQLAMHSCREMCAASSVDQAVRFYAAYFEHLCKIWPPVAN